MEITYLGHSAFKLKGKSATLVTDPFDPQMVGLPFPRISADIVTISHAHKDHSFLERVTDVKKVVDAPGEYEIAQVSIIGLGVFHDDKKGSVMGKNTIFVVEMEGLRIAHLGDLGHALSEEMIEELGSIDILMVPCGAEFTIGPETASEIVRQIEPSMTIPMHFLASSLNKEVFGSLKPVDLFLKEAGLDVERVDRLVVKKETLGEERKIVMFDTKS